MVCHAAVWRDLKLDYGVEYFAGRSHLLRSCDACHI